MRYLFGVIAFAGLLLSALFLLAGCEEKYPVYSSPIATKSGTLPNCLHYTIFDAKEKVLIQQSFGVEDSKDCDYRVELTKYHIVDCNNPLVKSKGSDFDGYIRIEIKKGMKTIYKIQSDYKSDREAAFQRVLNAIEKIER